MIQNTYHRNRVRCVILLLFLLMTDAVCTTISAQATLGAREIALGQASSALPNSNWSVFENVAMIDAKRADVSFFGFQYYGLSELADISAVITIPANFGVIGGGVHRYGNDKFNKTRLRLAYKNEFQKFHYGIALHYNHVMQGGGYGSVGALGIDAGIAALITDGLWIGAKATNINQPKYGKYANDVEDLPRNLSIGISYQLSDLALFTTDVIKDVDFPISYRAGLELKVVDRLKARAGITTAPQTFAAGFGYNTRTWGANIVVQRHSDEVLGYSPGIDFNISW